MTSLQAGLHIAGCKTWRKLLAAHKKPSLRPGFHIAGIANSAGWPENACATEREVLVGGKKHADWDDALAAAMDVVGQNPENTLAEITRKMWGWTVKIWTFEESEAVTFAKPTGDRRLVWHDSCAQIPPDEDKFEDPPKCEEGAPTMHIVRHSNNAYVQLRKDGTLESPTNTVTVPNGDTVEELRRVPSAEGYRFAFTRHLGDFVQVRHSKGVGWLRGQFLTHVNSNMTQFMDEEGEAFKARITEETGKFQTIQNLVAEVRTKPSPSACYSAVRTLLPFCSGSLANTGRFEQEVVEALVPPNFSSEIEEVKNSAVERLAQFLPGHQACMEALETTKQAADAQLLPNAVCAFQELQQTLHSAQQDKNNQLKLVKDPSVEVALVDSLRNGGENKRVALRKREDLIALRNCLDDGYALTSDMDIGGVFLAEGSVLLAKETVLMLVDASPKTFNLVEENIPENGFWMEASFRKSYPEAQLHSESFCLEAEYEKLEVSLAEGRQSGIELMACKTWESAVSLNPKLELVRSKTSEMKTKRDNFAPSTQEPREQAANLLRQLDVFQSSYDATLSDVATRLHECEQDKTEAHIQLLRAKQRSQECLAGYVDAFSDQRVKHAQHELLSCFQDSLEMKYEELRRLLEQSGLQSARGQAQELLSKTEEADARAADITKELEDRVAHAASAFQRAHQVWGIALGRSIVEREKALEEQQLHLDTIGTKRAELYRAARLGQGKVVELLKVQGMLQVSQRKTESLQKQQEVASQLQQHLHDISTSMVLAEESNEDGGESTADDITNRADQVFHVFDELTPVPEPSPCPATPGGVTTFDELARSWPEIQKEMEKAREVFFADGVKQGRKMQQRMQPSSSTASSSQLESLAFVARQDDGASEASDDWALVAQVG